MKISFRRNLHHTLVALFCLLLLSVRFGSSFPVSSLVTSTSTILLLPSSNINEKNNNNNHHEKKQRKNLIQTHHHHHYFLKKNEFRCNTFLNSENVRGGGNNIITEDDLSEKNKNGILANDAYNLILNKRSLFLIGLMSSLSLILYRFNVFHICSISDKTNFFLLSLLSSSSQSKISPSCHTTPSNTISTIAVPLLSSSCCIIQLVLNILIPSFGCAGFGKLFNKKSLKWIRPFFISILLHFTVISSTKGMMMLLSRQRGLTVPFVTILLKFVLKLSTMWVLSLLPEIVHFWNRNEIMRQTNQSIHRRQGSRSTTTSTTQKTTDDNGKVCNLTFDIHIPSMGCVGCVNKILSSLKTLNNNIEKVNVDAWLHSEKKDESSSSSSSSGGGAARVEISLPVGSGGGADDGISMSIESEEDIYEIKERIEKELVERITNSGFERSVIKSSKFVIS